MYHRRTTDASEMPGIEHARETDTQNVVRHILGMPISALRAIVGIIIALFLVWLAHDRAIASVTMKEEATEQRVHTLEKKDEDRTKQDAAVLSALSRIETKVDDVKDRVTRVENNQAGGKR